jgi:hypothetical protein
VTFLKDNINQPLKKIIYFSDGTAAQYKNQNNFLKFTLHQDFREPAQWHFFATSHQTSASDVLAKLLKDCNISQLAITLFRPNFDSKAAFKLDTFKFN